VLELDTSHEMQHEFQTAEGRGYETPPEFIRRYAHELKEYGLSVASGTLAFVDGNSSFMNEFYKEDGECRPNGACSQASIGWLNGLELQKFQKAERTESRACDARAYFEQLAHSRETSQNFAEQIWKAAKCYQLILAWEAKEGYLFDWVLRWRTDVIFVIPLPPLPPVPKSFATSIFTLPSNQDWFILCKREHCHGYFVDGSKRMLNCTVGPDQKFGFIWGGKDSAGKSRPATKVAFGGYSDFTSIDIPSTLFRKNGVICGAPELCHHPAHIYCSIMEKDVKLFQAFVLKTRDSSIMKNATDTLTENIKFTIRSAGFNRSPIR